MKVGPEQTHLEGLMAATTGLTIGMWLNGTISSVLTGEVALLIVPAFCTLLAIGVISVLATEKNQIGGPSVRQTVRS